jgi:hypothetical protein
MAVEQLRLLSIRRGLCGAIIAAVAAAALVMVLSLGFWAAGQNHPMSEMGSILREEAEQMIGPIIGCAAVCACAGWATYAPVGQYRFAWSLATVFVASVCLWLVAGALDFAPRHYKGMTAREWYPRLAAFVTIPPVVVAACLTVVRVRAARQRQAEPVAEPNGTSLSRKVQE